MINSIIGAGIFGLPSRVFALAGTYSLLAYVVSAAAIVLIILCFAEVGSRFKVTGGPYLYARVAFGPLVGFQVGWLMWLGRIAAFAALCNLSGNGSSSAATMSAILSQLVRQAVRHPIDRDPAIQRMAASPKARRSRARFLTTSVVDPALLRV